MLSPQQDAAQREEAVCAHACQTVDRGLGFGHITVGPMSAHELM